METQTSHKERLDFLFKKHYNYLLEIAGGCTIKKTSTNNRIKYDLLHDTIVQLYEKLENNFDFLNTENGFLNYMKLYMKNKYIWELSKSYHRKQDFSIITYCPNIDPEIATYMIEQNQNENSENLIYLQAESVNEDTKDFLRDLLLNDITIERGLQFNRVMQLYDEKILTLRERELFHSIFLDKQSVLTIFKENKKEDTPSTQYHYLLKEVKELKIKIKSIINYDN